MDGEDFISNIRCEEDGHGGGFFDNNGVDDFDFSSGFFIVVGEIEAAAVESVCSGENEPVNETSWSLSFNCDL